MAATIDDQEVDIVDALSWLSKHIAGMGWVQIEGFCELLDEAQDEIKKLRAELAARPQVQ